MSTPPVDVFWNAYAAEIYEHAGAHAIGERGSVHRLTYLALGLVGEAGEFVKAWITQKGMKKELGDVCWYLAMLTIETKCVQEWFSVDHLDPWDLLLAASDVAEIAKRPASGRDYDQELLHVALKKVARAVYDQFLYDGNFKRCLDANLAKLRARHPHKWAPPPAEDTP